MTSEFTRAAEISNRIVMIGSGKWTELLAGDDFFFLYKYYLQIIVSANDNEKQLKWWVVGVGETANHQFDINIPWFPTYL